MLCEICQKPSTRVKCRKCYDKEWYQKNKAKRDAQINNWKKENRTKVREIEKRSQGKRSYENAVRQASSRRLEWDIPKELYEQLTAQPCHYCEEDTGPIGVRLDRKNNLLGYLPDNVLSCCGRCNLIRMNLLTVEEMKAGMESLKAHWRRHGTN